MLLRLQNSYASMNEMVRRQERTANNLANANTIGFKRDRDFAQALNERLDAEQAPRSDVQTTQFADLQPGSLEQTGNPLDFAIEGEGFFVLSDANGGFRYTRAGRFTLGADNVLRDPTGLAVEGEDGPIQFQTQSGKIEVGAGGEIRQGNQLVGRLRVVTFPDPMNLRRLDGASFDSNGMRATDVAEPNVRQAVLETSNVNTLKEMTDMITHFRVFESQQKVLHTTDQILGAITRDLGRF